MTHYSGLEILVIRSDSNFRMIGERTNVTGSAKFRNLIEADDYDAAFRNCLSRLSQTIGLDKLGEGFETILAGEAARILVSPNA